MNNDYTDIIVKAAPWMVKNETLEEIISLMPSHLVLPWVLCPVLYLGVLDVLLKMDFKARYHTRWANVVRSQCTAYYHSRVTDAHGGRKMCSCGAEWNAVTTNILSQLVRYGPTIALGNLDYVFFPGFGCCEHGRVGITEWRAKVEAEVAKVPDFSTFLYS